jgi:hypothetical protein
MGEQLERLCRSPLVLWSCRQLGCQSHPWASLPMARSGLEILSRTHAHANAPFGAAPPTQSGSPCVSVLKSKLDCPGAG